MKRPEDMSREELIEEIISVSKRLEETDRQDSRTKQAGRIAYWYRESNQQRPA